MNSKTKSILMLLLATVLSPFGIHAASDVKPSGKLPVIYINTDDPTQSPNNAKDTYLKAKAYVSSNGVAGYEDMATVSLQIKGHGNYTYSSFNKKPYRLKFDEKQKPLGMKKSKHFLLMAGADDNLGFLRNIVGYETSRRLGLAYTPDAQPVELVLNGDYRGLYFITDKIRVEKNRVNIVEQNDNETDATKIAGGWLVEIDNYNADPHIDVNMGGNTMWVTYHSPESLSDIQKNYLQSQWDSIATSLYCGNPDDTEWESHIDMEALAKVYICRELLQDEEGFHGSCYAYKDLDDTKWSFGPVWDFGNAYHDKDLEHYIFVRPQFSNWVNDRAWTFTNFRTTVRNLWKQFYENEYQSMDKYIDSIATVISDAAVSDYNRWKDDTPGSGMTKVNVTNDETAKASQFKDYMHKKAAWLKKKWIDEPDKPTAADSVNIYVYPAEGRMPYLYTWGNQSLGGWPGIKMTQTVTYDGKLFYKYRIVSGTNIIFSYGGGDAQMTQTLDINNVDTDQWYYFYQGKAQYNGYKCGHYNSYDSSEALVAAGIKTLKEKTGSDNTRYNLAGQRVDDNYRGIVIVNEKKHIARPR